MVYIIYEFWAALEIFRIGVEQFQTHHLQFESAAEKWCFRIAIDNHTL
jgi:hypothetical protein